MARPPVESEEQPGLQTVLDALDDPDCREIVRRLNDAMTAREISEACDLPLSTTYRKLDLLTEASLLEETTEIRQDGHHTTRYLLGFDAVEVTLQEDTGDGHDRTFEVEVSRPARTADERLAELWSEVRRET